MICHGHGTWMGEGVTMAYQRVCWIAAAGLAVIALVGAGPVRAQQERPSGAEVFSEFLACESVPDPTEQLICFRTALKKYKLRFGLLSGRVEDAARDNPAAIVGVQGSGRTSSRRAGASPLVSAPPADDSPKARRVYRQALAQSTPKRVEGVIVEARRDPLGYWIFTLDNGQVWKEASKSQLRETNRLVNRRAVIKKGLLGSWHIKIQGIGSSGRVVRIR